MFSCTSLLQGRGSGAVDNWREEDAKDIWLFWCTCELCMNKVLLPQSPTSCYLLVFATHADKIVSFENLISYQLPWSCVDAEPCDLSSIVISIVCTSASQQMEWSGP